MEEEGIPNIKSLKLSIYESREPEKAKMLKKKVEERFEKLSEEVESMIENELEEYFKQKELEAPKRTYIG